MLNNVQLVSAVGDSLAAGDQLHEHLHQTLPCITSGSPQETLHLIKANLLKENSRVRIRNSEQSGAYYRKTVRPTSLSAILLSQFAW